MSVWCAQLICLVTALSCLHRVLMKRGDWPRVFYLMETVEFDAVPDDVFKVALVNGVENPHFLKGSLALLLSQHADKHALISEDVSVDCSLILLLSVPRAVHPKLPWSGCWMHTCLRTWSDGSAEIGTVLFCTNLELVEREIQCSSPSVYLSMYCKPRKCNNRFNLTI